MDISSPTSTDVILLGVYFVPCTDLIIDRVWKVNDLELRNLGLYDLPSPIARLSASARG